MKRIRAYSDPRSCMLEMRKVRGAIWRQKRLAQDSEERANKFMKLAVTYSDKKEAYESVASNYRADQRTNEKNAEENKEKYKAYKSIMQKRMLPVENRLMQFILGTNGEHAQDIIVSYVMKQLRSDNFKCLKATNVGMTLRVDATCEGLWDWVEKPLGLKDVRDWFED